MKKTKIWTLIPCIILFTTNLSYAFTSLGQMPKILGDINFEKSIHIVSSQYQVPSSFDQLASDFMLVFALNEECKLDTNTTLIIDSAQDALEDAGLSDESADNILTRKMREGLNAYLINPTAACREARTIRDYFKPKIW